MAPPADAIQASSPRADRSLPRSKRKAAPVKPSLNLPKPQAFVTITADQSKLSQDFIIHKSFLVHYSPFFWSAFETRFKPGSTQSMKLENVTSVVFGLVQHWVYLQNLPSPPLEAPSLENLAKVWLAAERFQIQALQNHPSGALCDRLTEFEGSFGMNSGLLVLDDQFDDYLASVKHIYFSTPAGEHKLKLLVLDIFPYNQLAYTDRIEDFPIAFCQDIARLLAKKTPAAQKSWPVSREYLFTVS